MIKNHIVVFKDEIIQCPDCGCDNYKAIVDINDSVFPITDEFVYCYKNDHDSMYCFECRRVLCREYSYGDDEVYVKGRGWVR